MIDPGLVAMVRKAIESKPRNYISPAVLLSVTHQEAGDSPIFIDTKPGGIYRMNVAGATSFWSRRKLPDGRTEKRRIYTGLNEAQIRELIRIPEHIGGFSPPKMLVGKLAKFRFESGYWQRFPHLSKVDRFYYSCSWGLVQFMGPNISKTPDAKGIEFIRRFAADIPMQLLYGAGMLDDLLTRAHRSPVEKKWLEELEKRGDSMVIDGKQQAIVDLVRNATPVERAYKAYNSGFLDSAQEAVIRRARAVAGRAIDTDVYLKRIGGA